MFNAKLQDDHRTLVLKIMFLNDLTIDWVATILVMWPGPFI